jgi:hypothetical protein
VRGSNKFGPSFSSLRCRWLMGKVGQANCPSLNAPDCPQFCFEEVFPGRGRQTRLLVNPFDRTVAYGENCRSDRECHVAQRLPDRLAPSEYYSEKGMFPPWSRCSPKSAVLRNRAATIAADLSAYGPKAWSTFHKPLVTPRCSRWARVSKTAKRWWNGDSSRGHRTRASS